MVNAKKTAVITKPYPTTKNEKRKSKQMTQLEISPLRKSGHLNVLQKTASFMEFSDFDIDSPVFVPKKRQIYNNEASDLNASKKKPIVQQESSSMDLKNKDEAKFKPSDQLLSKKTTVEVEEEILMKPSIDENNFVDPSGASSPSSTAESVLNVKEMLSDFLGK